MKPLQKILNNSYNKIYDALTEDDADVEVAYYNGETRIMICTYNWEQKGMAVLCE